MDPVIIKDRIVGLHRIKASELKKNPKNWRAHPEGQRSALSAMLADIGMVGAGIGRRLPDGSFELIDGHLRGELAGDQEIPVLEVDLTDEEAERALLTFDPLGGLAEIDPEMLGDRVRLPRLGSGGD